MSESKGMNPVGGGSSSISTDEFIIKPVHFHGAGGGISNGFTGV